MLLDITVIGSTCGLLKMLLAVATFNCHYSGMPTWFENVGHGNLPVWWDEQCWMLVACNNHCWCLSLNCNITNLHSATSVCLCFTRKTIHEGLLFFRAGTSLCRFKIAITICIVLKQGEPLYIVPACKLYVQRLFSFLSKVEVWGTTFLRSLDSRSAQ